MTVGKKGAIAAYTSTHFASVPSRLEPHECSRLVHRRVLDTSSTTDNPLSVERKHRDAATDLPCPSCGLLMVATESGFHYCAYERAGMHPRARRFAFALAAFAASHSDEIRASGDLFPQPTQLALELEPVRRRPSLNGNGKRPRGG